MVRVAGASVHGRRDGGLLVRAVPGDDSLSGRGRAQ